MNKINRKYRKHMRKNGRLVPVKRTDAARNARPKVKFIVHGGSRSLLRDPFDMRTRVGRAYAMQQNALKTHVGGVPTVPQERLIDQAVRLGLLADIAWSALIRAGKVVNDGGQHPAFEAYLKATRDQRDIFKLLGITTHQRQVLDVAGEIARQNLEDNS